MIVGNPIRTYYRAATGLLLADFDIVLGLDDAEAPETVTVTELGTTGVYAFEFTPLSTGTYGLLVVDNATPGSFDREWVVVSAGAEFTADLSDAYCAASDIERYAGETWSATTQPSDDSVAAYAVDTATQLTAIVARAGLTIAPGYSADATLVGMLRKANALGAAVAAKMAAFSGNPPNKEIITALDAEYLRLVGGLVGSKQVDGEIALYVAQIAGSGSSDPAASFAATHVSRDGVSAYQAPAGSTESMTWNRDRRW